ncbi:hypothetical protein MMC31_007003, partial [Peltigera leucophlebia]|nr:hypothetical protein [Peltigera leucophlebia]
MHLNQFYHAECELLGTLNDGIDVAERYIIAITHAILDKHVDTICAVARTTSRIDDLLSLANKDDGHFPRVTLSDALLLNEILNNAYAWDPRTILTGSEYFPGYLWLFSTGARGVKSVDIGDDYIRGSGTGGAYIGGAGVG